jgi:hypothetical protein
MMGHRCAAWRTALFAVSCGVWCACLSPTMAADIPSYRAVFLGSGSPVGVNNLGTVAGVQLVGTSNYRPVVSRLGANWQLLPVPTNAVSVFPTGLNDSDVLVGVSYDAQFNPVAVRWLPTSAGYSVEVLPRLAGDPSSYATGINSVGDIVGARRALGYVPAATSGWIYNDGTGVVDLLDVYDLATVPSRVNDADQLLSGGLILDLNTGTTVDVGGLGPANYNRISGVDLNNTGMVVGTAALRSSSLNIVTAFLYTPGQGWQTIGGTSRYTVATDVNNFGDVGWGEQGAGVFLQGLGGFVVNDLRDAATLAQGWVITGNGCYLNDDRTIVSTGRNAATGQSGTVVLIASGVLLPPAAPTNLTATPHPSTSSEPYNSIDLSWVNVSPLTKTYELERRVSGAATWDRVPLVPPGMSTRHVDATVALSTTYDYRVRAVGVAGAGPWSATATATAPTVIPTTPMVVSAIELSGRVRRNNVSLQATVDVRSGSGTPVVNARVDVQWIQPNGVIKAGSAVTNSSGRARFATSGPRGTYTLSILDVVKDGYSLNAAGSVLDRSITR